jgi:hypothetical protein
LKPNINISRASPASSKRTPTTETNDNHDKKTKNMIITFRRSDFIIEITAKMVKTPMAKFMYDGKQNHGTVFYGAFEIFIEY